MADQKKMNEVAEQIDLALRFMPGILSNPEVYHNPEHAVNCAFRLAAEFKRQTDKMWAEAGYVS